MLRQRVADLELWRKDIPDADRLRIINEGDFPLADILASLGLSRSQLNQSFGITDVDEIKNRQGLCGVMLRSPEFRRWCLDRRDSARTLPDSGDAFLQYNDPERPHNPYWAEVRSALDLLDRAGPLPERLTAMVTHLRGGLGLEQRERQMAAEITARLETVTVLEGLFTFLVSEVAEVKDDQRSTIDDPRYRIDSLVPTEVCVHGHSEFSQIVERAKNHELPRHARHGWNPFGWPARIHQAYLDHVLIKRASRSMVIDQAEQCLIDEVRTAVQGLLNQTTWRRPDLIDTRVTVYAFYSRSGLEIQVLNVDSPPQENDEQNLFRAARTFDGYTADQIRQIRQARRRYAVAVEEIRQSVDSQARRMNLEASVPGLFTKRHAVPSSMTDQKYRYFAITNLYLSPRFRALHDALIEHRSFFRSFLAQLKEIAELISSLSEQADKFGVPLTAPEVVDGDHLVAFDGLFPTQLLFRMKRGKVVPLNGIPELNGSFIGLTGHHGGGKTETLITIAANLYLAQSGLPVFAHRFRFNVKRVLGLTFIPHRGVGSTIEQMVGKMRNVLKGIRGVPGHEVVVLLDEIGTGTQAQSGIKLGQDLLTRLQSLGCSVIFSSQLKEIAEYAEQRLGAQNFKFNRRHRIQPGIGDGGLETLLEETGLGKLLEVR